MEPQIVAIGASAGGLKAIRQFLSSFDSPANIAFVILQHLSSDFPSHMKELIAGYTAFKVQYPANKQKVKAGNIYVLPARKKMIYLDGLLLVEQKDSPKHLSHPIDRFFRSIAICCGPRAVGVILSGTGNDGTAGAREIKKAGGMVLCQDPETAEFAGMPESAIASGCVDRVAACEEMGPAIEAFAQNFTPGDLSVDSEEQEEVEGKLSEVLKLFRIKFGLDLSSYRQSSILRRFERRLELSSAEREEAYLDSLYADDQELERLYNDLFIGVTSFFRDKNVFRQMEQEVVAKLCENTAEGKEIRVWVCGCATGEEAYSIAILFHERLEKLQKNIRLKLFASDIRASYLKTAAEGVYSGKALRNLTSERKDKYFSQLKDGSYRIDPVIRQSMVFVNHNVLEAAPFTRMDFISCRNLLIYLQKNAQKRTLQLFNFGLGEKGFLLLGKSESLNELDEAFEVVNSEARIFRKKSEVRLPVMSNVSSSHVGSSLLYSFEKKQAVRNLEKIYDELLAKHIPPGFLVDRNYDLVHAFPGSETFMQVRSGRPTRCITELVHTDLRMPISGGLHRCFHKGVTVNIPVLTLQTGEESFRVKLKIEPVEVTRGERLEHAMLYLDKHRLEELPVPITSVKPNGHAAELDEGAGGSNGELTLPDFNETLSEQIQLLEKELKTTQESLRGAVEELAASNEESQAANEELTAANEELQSSNEELHSVNEELYSLNNELEEKNKQLLKTTSDLENLMASIRIGVVYLDKELSIRMFTPEATQVFHLKKTDIGRELDSFSHTLVNVDIGDHLRKALQSGEVSELEVRDRSDSVYLMRVLPYRSERGVQGVICTFVNISQLREAERQLEILRQAVESSEDAVIASDLEGRITGWNRGAEEMYGYLSEEIFGQSLRILCPDNAAWEELQKILNRIRQGKGEAVNETIRVTKSGKRIDVLKRASPIIANAEIVGMSVIDRDFSDYKALMKRLRESEKDQRHHANLLQGIIDQLPDMLVVMDSKRNITSISPEAEAFLQKEDIKDRLFTLLRPHLNRAIAEGIEYRPVNFEGTLSFKIGQKERFFLPRISLIPSAEDSSPRIVLLLQDVTEFKLLDEVKSSLLGTVSHELKTPLTSIRMALWLLLDNQTGELNEMQRKILEPARNETERALLTLESLLDLTRFEQGFGDLSRTRVVLTDLVNSVVMEHRQSQKSNLPVIIKAENSLPEVKVDPHRIRQCISNFLVNAEKYGETSEPVTIRIGRENGSLRLEVADRGPGIPDPLKAKIFRKFFRGESDKENGTGLGLSIVSEFIRAHGGEVGVYDNEPRGAVFYFTLPVEHTEANESG